MSFMLPVANVFLQEMHYSHNRQAGAGDRGHSQSGHRRKFSMDTPDILAIGVLVLALGAVTVAIIVAIGLVTGRVSESAASKIIIGCVGGSAISGVVAALLGKKRR